MQFAAPVAANGNQRQVGNLTETGFNPQALKQLINKFGAGLNELFCGNSTVKRFA